MNTQNAAHRSVSVVLAVVLVGGIAGLAGCRTNAEASGPADQVVTIRYERVAVDPHQGLPADRLEEAVARDTSRAAELSARFAGRPADRIEEQLAREATQ